MPFNAMPSPEVPFRRSLLYLASNAYSTVPSIEPPSHHLMMEACSVPEENRLGHFLEDTEIDFVMNVTFGASISSPS